jgi:hypothetical protein
MTPDLRNVVTATEADNGHGPRIVARHRAFPEAQADGKSPHEALLGLRSALKRSEAWTTDAWLTADLARAIFDVESLLWLLDSPDRAMISGGDHSKIIKEYDTVYYLTYCPGEEATAGADRGEDWPDFLDAQDAAAPAILVYSLGRRRGPRRSARSAGEPGAGQPERRVLDRRNGHRRQLSRVALVADIPVLGPDGSAPTHQGPPTPGGLLPVTAEHNRRLDGTGSPDGASGCASWLS